MKKTLLISSIIVAFASAAMAGSVQEKKAKDYAQSIIDDWLNRMSTTCGITPTVQVNWSAIDGYDFASLGRDKNNVIKTIGSNVGTYISNLKDVCDDADYKAAVAGMSTISITPTADPNANGNKNKLSYSGGTLSIEMAPIVMDNDAIHHLREVF